MANFTIDPEDLIKQRISDRLAIQEGLPQQGAALEETMPLTSRYPNTTANAQGIASPEQVQYLMNNLEQRFPSAGSAGVQAPPSAEQIGQQVAQNPEQAMIAMGLPPVVAKEIAKNMNDTNPPKLIGSDILGTGRGGIMGLGIEPIDVLAFAFGAAITGRLPQDQAINATMMIAGLPRRYKDAQRKAGGEVISQLLQAGNLAQQQQQLANTQAVQAEKAAERKAVLDWTELVAQQAASNVPLTASKRIQLMALGARAKIPADVMRQTLILHPSEQLAQAEMVRRLLGGENIETKIDLGDVTVTSKPEKQASDLTQRTREELAIAKANGETISVGEASERAVQKTIREAGGKAGAVAQATPLSGEASNVINVGQDVQRQIKIMKDNLDEGVKLLGKKNLSKTYTETILPMTKLTDGQQKFLQAYLKLAQWNKVQITGAAAAVEEMKSIFATLPQMFANEKNFRAGLEKTDTDASAWTQRYGSMVTQPKSETGKQFKPKEDEQPVYRPGRR